MDTATIEQRILAELVKLNDNFNNYYKEWQVHQLKHDELMGEAKGSLKMYEKMTQNMKPEDMKDLAKSLSGVDMKEMMKMAGHMWEDKAKEDEEFKKKLRGVK